MTTLRATREAWQPRTEVDREIVRRELHAVLESPFFCNSRRYPMFLRYVVDRALAGDAHLIKERTVGVEVFGRSPDYDTNADTVVRFTAGEVRKRLALFNHEHEADSVVQISLPAGSYIPEFHMGAPEEPSPNQTITPSAANHSTASEQVDTPVGGAPGQLADVLPLNAPAVSPIARPQTASNWKLLFWALATIVAGILIAVSLRSGYSRTAVDQFWAPLFGERGPVLVGSGAVVFAPDRVSGTLTANRTNEYPFASMQIVTAIARVTGVLERHNAPYEIRSAPYLTLTDMRERPAVLVGGYNNEWTMRLVSALRFSFLPGTDEAIVDHDHPGVRWARDPKVPYGSADDYALVGRFRDPTTDSLIFVIAGLGRNGTEAAAQFVTTPRYLEQLEQQAGSGWKDRNLEAVLKTRVIDGRTGAPSVVAVHVW